MLQQLEVVPLSSTESVLPALPNTEDFERGLCGDCPTLINDEGPLVRLGEDHASYNKSFAVNVTSLLAQVTKANYCPSSKQPSWIAVREAKQFYANYVKNELYRSDCEMHDIFEEHFQRHRLILRAAGILN